MAILSIYKLLRER
jgi:hypothetical protein